MSVKSLYQTEQLPAIKVFSCTQKQEKEELAMEITRGDKLVIENQQYFSFMSSPSTPHANSCPLIHQSWGLISYLYSLWL